MLIDHLEKLKQFRGCVHWGSIKRYAVQSGLSQSGVSKAVQILESDLDTVLFQRSREGLKLTSAGEELLRLTEEILDKVKSSEERIRESSQIQLKGKLTIGTYQSVAVYFIPLFFKFILSSQRNLSVKLVTASSSELVSILRNGVADFIVSIDPPKRADLFQEVVHSDSYSLYRSRELKSSLKQSTLYTVPYARDRNGKLILSYLGEKKLDGILSPCSDFESVKALTEAGIGYGIMPDRVAKMSCDAGRLEIVNGPEKLVGIGEHDIVFSCRKARFNDKSIQWVYHQLKSMIKHPL